MSVSAADDGKVFAYTPRINEGLAVGMRRSDKFEAEILLDQDDPDLSFEEIRQTIPFPT
ncbi:hypothetical protein ACI3KS_08855 [Microbacterium sp. ZW T5_45]|uniref:hypothetical protein n=1 Tax=Microbacterium sp. ZW T5_45 TaxID=3378080 RepID=UPI003851E9D3